MPIDPGGFSRVWQRFANGTVFGSSSCFIASFAASTEAVATWLDTSTPRCPFNPSRKQSKEHMVFFGPMAHIEGRDYENHGGFFGDMANCRF